MLSRKKKKKKKWKMENGKCARSVDLQDTPQNLGDRADSNSDAFRHAAKTPRNATPRPQGSLKSFSLDFSSYWRQNAEKPRRQRFFAAFPKKTKKRRFFLPYSACPLPARLPSFRFRSAALRSAALFPQALSCLLPEKKRRRAAPKMQDPGFGRSAKMKQREGKNHSFDLSCRSAGKRRAQADGRTSWGCRHAPVRLSERAGGRLRSHKPFGLNRRRLGRGA